PWFAARTLDVLRAAFDGSGVLWAPYQDFRQLVEEDPRCSAANPLFGTIDQPGVGRVLAPRVPLAFSGTPTPPAQPAAEPGADTAHVLTDVLGLPEAQIAALRARGIIG